MKIVWVAARAARRDVGKLGRERAATRDRDARAAERRAELRRVGEAQRPRRRRVQCRVVDVAVDERATGGGAPRAIASSSCDRIRVAQLGDGTREPPQELERRDAELGRHGALDRLASGAYARPAQIEKNVSSACGPATRERERVVGARARRPRPRSRRGAVADERRLQHLHLRRRIERQRKVIRRSRSSPPRLRHCGRDARNLRRRRAARHRHKAVGGDGLAEVRMIEHDQVVVRASSGIGVDSKPSSGCVSQTMSIAPTSTGCRGSERVAARMIPGQAAERRHSAVFGDDAAGDQVVDVEAVVAELGEDRAAVLAGQRRAGVDARGRAREADREARRAHRALGRMLVVHERAVVLDLRVVEDVLVAVDRAGPAALRLEGREPVGRRAGEQPLLRDLQDRVAVLPGVALVVEAGELRRAEHDREVARRRKREAMCPSCVSKMP